MDLVNTLLGLLAIICLCLAGIAASGYLAAKRLNDAPANEPTTPDRTDERNTES
ncbi:hypothetical protein ABCS02_33300 [Microbacterium sp. X-17]|uniref:hypothetical protein n=1 Tax=Microbacteriaceae TaxID=85023 RepID=UPI0031F4AFE6